MVGGVSHASAMQVLAVWQWLLFSWLFRNLPGKERASPWDQKATSCHGTEITNSMSDKEWVFIKIKINGSDDGRSTTEISLVQFFVLSLHLLTLLEHSRSHMRHVCCQLFCLFFVQCCEICQSWCTMSLNIEYYKRRMCFNGMGNRKGLRGKKDVSWCLECFPLFISWKKR